MEGEVGSSEWRERKSVNTTSRTNIRSVFSIPWAVRFDETNQKRGTMSTFTTKDGTQPSSYGSGPRRSGILTKQAWKA